MSLASRTPLEQINECKYLVVRSVEITKGFGLLLIVDELIPRKAFPENPERDFEPAIAARISAEISAEVIPHARSFEIVFGHYISYTVSNEMYGKYPSPPEVFIGKLFREFSWSYLLELTRKTTYADDDHPGPERLQHYEVVGQDEIYDVIATERPVLRLLNPKE